MTAPVVMGYAPQSIERKTARGAVSMEFRYRRPDQGLPGPGEGRVQMEFHPAAAYVCLGLQEPMSQERLRAGVARLRQWLSQRQDQWLEAGPPRRLGYHGSQTPAERRLWEIQIPVKASRAPAGEAGAGEKDPC